MRFHVTIRKRKISGSDIIKLTQLEINRTAIKEKIVEAALSVLPIAVIVLLLCLMVTPMRPDLLLCFLIGAVMLVVGMGLFSLGAEQSMTPIGSKIGTALTRTKNMPLILGVSFLLGSYAIHKNLSDVVVMLIFGVLGYLMRKFDLNTAAVVLALILGPISEKGLRGALRVSGGDLGCLFASPVSWVLIVLSVIGIFSPILMAKFEKKVTGGEVLEE